MDKGIPLVRTQRARFGGQLSEELRVRSGVPEGSILFSLLFLAYIKILGGISNELLSFLLMTV